MWRLPPLSRAHSQPARFAEFLSRRLGGWDVYRALLPTGAPACIAKINIRTVLDWLGENALMCGNFTVLL